MRMKLTQHPILKYCLGVEVKLRLEIFSIKFVYIDLNHLVGEMSTSYN